MAGDPIQTTTIEAAIEAGIEAASEAVSTMDLGQKAWGAKEFEIARTAARAAVAAIASEPKKARKSYWQSCSAHDDRAKEAIKSWFEPLCEGMTPYKAEVLCDEETDREKKIRAFMTNEAGKHYVFERTRGGKTWTMSCKPFTPAARRERADGQ